MEIVRYDNSLKKEWDDLVEASKNGTFLLKRDYMDYHSERFTDCSHLFYEKEKLIAVIPANINTEKHAFYSHQGLTYGGLVMKKDITATQVLAIFECFLPFIKDQYGVEKLLYRTIPFIYHTYPAEEDLYALFRNRANLLERKISSAIKMDASLPFRQSRKGGVSKAKRNALTVSRITDYTNYWLILSSVLSDRHNTQPVHSLEEIKLLSGLFPKEIYGYEVRKDGQILGGCIIYETKCVAHVQYIAATDAGKELGALDLLFDYLIKECFSDREYLDFGTSVEQNGWHLNENLIFQKEGFGARAIVYDTYELTL